MDDNFFNHLGPFFETTPRIDISVRMDKKDASNDITERSSDADNDRTTSWTAVSKSDNVFIDFTEKPTILPKVVNNDVTWAPTESEIDGIYESDYSYYYDTKNDDVTEYQWKPYDPTENEVNVTEFDELTAPSEDTQFANIKNQTETKIDPVDKIDPEALPFLQNFYTDYYDYKDYFQIDNDTKNQNMSEYRENQKEENSSSAILVDNCKTSKCHCVCEDILDEDGL